MAAKRHVAANLSIWHRTGALCQTGAHLRERTGGQLKRNAAEGASAIPHSADRDRTPATVEPAPVVVRPLRISKARGPERHTSDGGVLIAPNPFLARVQHADLEQVAVFGAIEALCCRYDRAPPDSRLIVRMWP